MQQARGTGKDSGSATRHRQSKDSPAEVTHLQSTEGRQLSQDYAGEQPVPRSVRKAVGLEHSGAGGGDSRHVSQEPQRPLSSA